MDEGHGVSHVLASIDMWKRYENDDVIVLVGTLLGGGAERPPPSECLVHMLVTSGVSICATLIITFFLFSFFLLRRAVKK